MSAPLEELFDAAIAAAKAEGASEATVAIVAWLRSNERQGGDDEIEQSELEAKAIERGDHLKPGAP